MNDDGEQLPAFSLKDLGDEKPFPITDVPPSTGEEYLRRVRLEAKARPQYVTVNFSERQRLLSKIEKPLQEKGHCSLPISFRPSVDWSSTFIQHFASLRIVSFLFFLFFFFSFFSFSFLYFFSFDFFLIESIILIEISSHFQVFQNLMNGPKNFQSLEMKQIGKFFVSQILIF